MSVEIISTSQQSLGRNVLLYPLLRQLKVAETIDASLCGESELPYGTVAEVMILSRFSDKRIPLYHISEFYEENGLDILYAYESEKLNDDRCGRCLDVMHPKLSDLKTAIILRAMKQFNLDVSQIHTDITNILFEGRYDSIEDGQLKVTWGHTKKGQDSRCKQVNFSLSVTADGGVPLYYEAVDGNRSDDVLYCPQMNALQKELGISHPLIIGDSKLVSLSNMLTFCRKGAKFIGPATLNKNEKKRLVALWEAGVGFEALFVKPETNSPIPYWGMEAERQITDKKKKDSYLIRHLYIFSRQRREVIRHTRAKSLLKALAALHKIKRCLNKYDYTTRHIIHSRIENQVKKKCKYYRIQLRQTQKGAFTLSYTIDWQQLRADERFDGIYVIRTNLLAKQYAMTDVLCAYKEQPFIEQSFQTVKQPPIEVSPVWLHKPCRIESLLFCVFVALLVIALLQREGRNKVYPRQIPLRPEGRDHLPLTAAVLLRAFDTVAVITITQKQNGRQWGTRKCTRLSVPQSRVLAALAFPRPELYLLQKQQNSGRDC